MSTQLTSTLRAELCAKALAHIARGHSIQETARHYQLSSGTVHYWVKHPRLAQPSGDARFALDWEVLRAEFEANPNLTLDALAERFNASRNAVWKALKKMGLSRNKTGTNTPQSRR
jgi:transposase